MNYEAIVIGGSVGGISALQTILTSLSVDFRWPILVVLHRLPVLDDLLAYTLNESCHLTVKEAEQNERIKPGRVYLAPTNYHLLVERDRTLSFSIDPKVCYSRPAIDVLFETAADAYLSGLIGVILTGANHDGTAGLKRIKQNGGLTIAQNPDTAESKVMPRSAIEENVVDKIFSLAEISSFLSQLPKKRMPDE